MKTIESKQKRRSAPRRAARTGAYPKGEPEGRPEALVFLHPDDSAAALRKLQGLFEGNREVALAPGWPTAGDASSPEAFRFLNALSRVEGAFPEIRIAPAASTAGCVEGPTARPGRAVPPAGARGAAARRTAVAVLARDLPAPAEREARAADQARLDRLWERFTLLRDIDSRNDLVHHYRSLVDREARRIAQRLPRRVDTRDLHTAGIVGLIDAIQNFDTARGVVFESYGRPRVRGAILDELRRSDWMPRSWRTRRTRRDQAAQKLRDSFGREPSDEELAGELGISAEEFRSEYGAPLHAVEISGSGPHPWGEEPGAGDRFDILADPRSGEEESRLQVRELIESLLAELEPQDRRVLYLRYFRGWTMARIGQLLRISESRVCRIHSGILERLKRRLESRRPEIFS